MQIIINQKNIQKTKVQQVLLALQVIITLNGMQKKKKKKKKITKKNIHNKYEENNWECKDNKKKTQKKIHTNIHP